MDTDSAHSGISSPVMNSSSLSDKDHQLLSAKYTKLASEYSKVRAQLGVLKKAVLEEQAKNVGASESLKQKEQALRKSEAEMDSLTFRNQQLTRRVEILQEDLEKKALESHGGSSRKKSSGMDNKGSTSSVIGQTSKVVSGHLQRDTDRVTASESLNSVMGEELQLKISENARLHAALDGVDKRYEDRIGALQSRISELEASASKQAQSERADDTRLKELVQGLKADNADLTSSNKMLERELENKNDCIVMLQVQLGADMKKSDFNNSTVCEDNLKLKHSNREDPTRPPKDADHSTLSVLRNDELNIKLDTLQNQMDNLNERLKKAEQEKEHWKVEYQLVQMKHDRLRKKHEGNKEQRIDDSNEDRPLDLGIILSDDKRIYENRISALVADRLLADSKASHFYLECVALQKRAKSQEKSKLNVEEQLQSAQDRISNLHDDIGTTNSNYEQQMSMMSEHLTNMNKKLADKTEEIQRLQFEINQKQQRSGGKR